MARFNKISIDEDSGAVEIGSGLTWTDVYDYLVPKGLNVVGGRLNGVGVAGLTLGGGKVLSPPSACPSYGDPLTGYSWKTNQYGLPADTVTEFELVLPSGKVKVVTEKDEDLWFALKVCLNIGV